MTSATSRPRKLRIPSPSGVTSRIRAQVSAALWRRTAAKIPHPSEVSYSLFGEDMVLRWVLERTEPGFFVDIGAYHPISRSNTYGLYCRGWSGINVEPNPGSLTIFEMLRPRDINLQLCIVPDQRDSVNYFRFDQHGHNTIDEEMARINQEEGLSLIESLDVPASSINALLDEHLPEDMAFSFLNIDVEGADEAILRDLDLARFRPDVICFELHRAGLGRLEEIPLVKYLSDQGYVLVAACADSLIMRHAEFRSEGMFAAVEPPNLETGSEEIER